MTSHERIPLPESSTTRPPTPTPLNQLELFSGENPSGVTENPESRGNPGFRDADRGDSVVQRTERRHTVVEKNINGEDRNRPPRRRVVLERGRRTQGGSGSRGPRKASGPCSSPGGLAFTSWNRAQSRFLSKRKSRNGGRVSGPGPSPKAWAVETPVPFEATLDGFFWVVLSLFVLFAWFGV